MPPAFVNSEYEAGFNQLREALLQGLRRLPPQRHAGSFLIGAYCGLVQLVWEQREPGSSRNRVASILATVMADVLAEADSGPATGEDPAATMVEAIRASVIACTPRGAEGPQEPDPQAALAACATYAVQTLLGLPDAVQRRERLGVFTTFVESQVDPLAADEAACSYPECGCDFDAICSAEISRRETGRGRA